MKQALANGKGLFQFVEKVSLDFFDKL